MNHTANTTQASPSALAALTAAVQHNCDIADARHAADMPLCTYLLQMRDYYRWCHGLPFGAPLPRADIGRWIAAREALWQAVEEQELQTLPMAGFALGLDPFDVATVNARLMPLGLVYGAGLVGQDRPVFFLGHLFDTTPRDGLQVLSAGQELARCLLAPPAVLAPHGARQAVLLRRESLARWGWEKFEAFSLRPTEGTALHAAVHAYGLHLGFDAALPRWLLEQSELVVLHELGEHRAGQQLGPAWAAMRVARPTRRADLFARAVRDHMADLAVTLPTLLQRGADASLHVWFASFDGTREALFPQLKAAYQAWRQGDGGAALQRATDTGHRHFSALAQAALALHLRHGDAAGAQIEALFSAPAAVCLA
jgi:hypothetical protein